MKTRYTVVLSMIAGAALGGAAIQGLHAEAKPKAYTITELETLDAQAAADVAKRIWVVQRRQEVVISALAFFKSKAWNDLAPAA